MPGSLEKQKSTSVRINICAFREPVVFAVRPREPNEAACKHCNALILSGSGGESNATPRKFPPALARATAPTAPATAPTAAARMATTIRAVRVVLLRTYCRRCERLTMPRADAPACANARRGPRLFTAARDPSSPSARRGAAAAAPSRKMGGARGVPLAHPLAEGCS